MKWKERLLLLASLFAMIVLFIVRKRAVDNSFVSQPEEITYVNRTINNIHSSNENNNIDLLEKWMGMHPWDIWKQMVTARAITHQSDKLIEKIMKEMTSSKILSADIGYKGTQLKARFTLAGPDSQLVVFKPKRYERSKILGGTPYEGYDRHNAEIAAFHLDRILCFYRTPPVVGRVVNLKSEVLPVAKKKLLKTFFKKGDDICFYGVCFYCKKEEPACGKGNIMEGSLTLWIPIKWHISKLRHPWQRTYSKRKAAWEVNDDYCNSVIQMVPYNKGPRLLDIMDAAIFDFLIGNADRHHYEYLSHDENNGMMLLLDNGKSFGNPYTDEMSILAPIYQCCQLRHSTYLKLQTFSSDSRNSTSLSNILLGKIKNDQLHPVLTENHLNAIDRRLKKVLDTLNVCFNKKGKNNVLKR